MHRSVLAAAVAVAVAGCATQGADQHPERAAYFMVSRGEVGIIYRWLTGGVDYCKVTQYNLAGTDFDATVDYDGETCTVSAIASDKAE